MKIKDRASKYLSIVLLCIVVLCVGTTVVALKKSEKPLVIENIFDDVSAIQGKVIRYSLVDKGKRMVIIHFTDNTYFVVKKCEDTLNVKYLSDKEAYHGR